MQNSNNTKRETHIIFLNFDDRNWRYAKKTLARFYGLDGGDHSDPDLVLASQN